MMKFINMFRTLALNLGGLGTVTHALMALDPTGALRPQVKSNSDEQWDVDSLTDPDMMSSKCQLKNSLGISSHAK